MLCQPSCFALADHCLCVYSCYLNKLGVTQGMLGSSVNNSADEQAQKTIAKLKATIIELNQDNRDAMLGRSVNNSADQQAQKTIETMRATIADLNQENLDAARSSMTANALIQQKDQELAELKTSMGEVSALERTKMTLPKLTGKIHKNRD